MPRYTVRLSKDKQSFIDGAVDNLVEECVNDPDQPQLVKDHIKSHAPQIKKMLSGAIGHAFALVQDDGTTLAENIPVQMSVLSIMHAMTGEAMTNLEHSLQAGAKPKGDLH